MNNSLKELLEKQLEEFKKKYANAREKCNCSPDEVLVLMLLNDQKDFLKSSQQELLKFLKAEIAGLPISLVDIRFLPKNPECIEQAVLLKDVFRLFSEAIEDNK
jgi:hypothetical protein